MRHNVFAANEVAPGSGDACSVDHHPAMSAHEWDDWDSTFSEVTERLRVSVRGTLESPDLTLERERLGDVQERVLECVGQLECLQEQLAIERTDRRRLRRACSDAQDGERRALHLAHHDPLTKLANRGWFLEQLALATEQSARTGVPLGVLFIDLDRLKVVNDTHGHAIGDEVLRIVAARLRRTVRGSDVVCRLGGDEYACLSRGATGRVELERLAESLFEAISAPMRIASIEMSVAPSIGIATCPDHARQVVPLMHAADRAMYRAKRWQTRHAYYEAEQDG
jgi:diguanylate cyclase (GGDEF)-like protein